MARLHDDRLVHSVPKVDLPADVLHLPRPLCKNNRWINWITLELESLDEAGSRLNYSQTYVPDFYYRFKARYANEDERTQFSKFVKHDLKRCVAYDKVLNHERAAYLQAMHTYMHHHIKDHANRDKGFDAYYEHQSWIILFAQGRILYKADGLETFTECMNREYDADIKEWNDRADKSVKMRRCYE